MDSHSDDKPFIGVFTTSTELIVRVWDDAMATMTGMNANASIGKHLKELIPNIESRRLLARFEHVRDFGTTEVLAPALHKNLFPCPPRHPSERFAQMRQLVTISALRNKNEIDGLIVVVEDVTQRMEREKELAEHLRDPDPGVRLRAAKSVADGGDSLGSVDVEPIIEALADKNWRVRRKLVDGLARRAAPEAIAALLEAVRKEHLDFGMLNGALQVLQATSIDTTETLLEFLRSDDDDLRMQAALALGQHKNNVAVGYLIAALDDENANVRYHAIEALGNLQAGEAVDPLLAIAESRDFFLSFAALDALKQIADPTVAERVASLLDDDLLREPAATVLGTTGNVDTVERIVELLNVGDLSVPVAAQALCTLFERHNLTASSGELVIERFARTISPSGMAALLDALESTNTPPNTETVKVAGWVTDDRAVQRLASLLEKESLREAALAALIRQGDAAIPFLIEKLQSDDVEVRADVARALGSIGSEASVDALIATLNSDVSVAPSAVEALGRSGSPKAFDALIELLASPDKALRRSTVNTLRRLPREDAIPRLTGLVSHTDPKIRESAIRLIGDLPTPESRDAVLAGAGDDDETVRMAALEHLRGLPNDVALNVLSRALNDASARVRSAAAQALTAFVDDESIHLLRTALSDDDVWVRYFAVRSLSENGGADRFADLLRDLAEHDPAEHVRIAAVEAITGGAV